MGDTPGYISGGQIGSRTVTSANLQTVYATQASVDSLSATVAEIERLVSGSATISYLRVNGLNYQGFNVAWGSTSGLTSFLGR